jgi:hypothetical protein
MKFSLKGLNVETTEAKEVLPENWNADAVYELPYVRNGERYLLKAIVVDGNLMVTFVVTITFALLYFSMNSNCIC